MKATLYVGNLAASTTEEELRETFRAKGQRLKKVRIMRDEITGQPRGFAFVELDNKHAAATAAEALDGTRLSGRPLSVALAQSGD